MLLACMSLLNVTLITWLTATFTSNIIGSVDAMYGLIARVVKGHGTDVGPTVSSMPDLSLHGCRVSPIGTFTVYVENCAKSTVWVMVSVLSPLLQAWLSKMAPLSIVTYGQHVVVSIGSLNV